MKTGYFDAAYQEIEVGDIMFNPFLGDVWLVKKWVDIGMKPDEDESPYCLLLNASEEDYVCDLTEPSGFVLECRESDEPERYKLLLAEMKQLAEERIK